MAPSSMSDAATQVRWSQIREYSESSVRRYRHRGVIAIPISVSTASQ